MGRPSLTATIRFAAYRKCYDLQENPCVVGCGRNISPDNFEGGHIQSLALGGENTVDNIVPICSMCNKSMGTINLIDFMKTQNLTSPWLENHLSRNKEHELPENIYYFVSKTGELEQFDHVIYDPNTSEYGYITFMDKKLHDRITKYTKGDNPFKNFIPLDSKITRILDGKIISETISSHKTEGLNTYYNLEHNHISWDIIESCLNTDEEFLYRMVKILEIDHVIDNSGSSYYSLAEQIKEKKIDALNNNEYTGENIPKDLVKYFSYYYDW